MKNLVVLMLAICIGIFISGCFKTVPEVPSVPADPKAIVGFCEQHSNCLFAVSGANMVSWIADEGLRGHPNCVSYNTIFSGTISSEPKALAAVEAPCTVETVKVLIFGKVGESGKKSMGPQETTQFSAENAKIVSSKRTDISEMWTRELKAQHK